MKVVVVDDSIEIISIPADDLAVELGNKKVTNMIALGAYLQRKGYLSTESVIEALPETIAERYHKTIPVNTDALRRGAEFVSREVCRQK